MAHPRIQILGFAQGVETVKGFSGFSGAPDLAGSFRSNGLYFFFFFSPHGLLFVMPELAIMEVIKFKDTAVNSSLRKAKGSQHH